MALNDAEVERQIKHMMAFIEQEAKEKAEEIDAKAEEEFNIEKGRLVQQERKKIMNNYEKKEKQVELQKRIQRSNLVNQCRLKILKSRDDHVKEILEETGENLGKVTADQQKYKQILTGLISQGLFQLLEPAVTIVCRQQDIDLVKQCIDESVAKLKEVTKQDCTVTVDEQNFLAQDCAGGVELIAKEGKIKVVNTFESRLELISTQMLPEIRTKLFGKSTSRKFFD